MPPKKKKGSGKKGKKGKKSGKKSAKAPSQGEQLSELTKEFYLIQIRDLENRLERYVTPSIISLMNDVMLLCLLFNKIWC